LSSQPSEVIKEHKCSVEMFNRKYGHLPNFAYSERHNFPIQICIKCKKRVPIFLYPKKAKYASGYDTICRKCKAIRKVNSAATINKFVWIDTTKNLTIDEAFHAKKYLLENFNFYFNPSHSYNQEQLDVITDLRYKKFVLLSSNLITKVPQWINFKLTKKPFMGKVCRCCGHQGVLTYDHILPRVQFPESVFDIENIQYLCSSCNRNKISGVIYKDKKPFVHVKYLNYLQKYYNKDVFQWLDYLTGHIPKHKQHEIVDAEIMALRMYYLQNNPYKPSKHQAEG